MGRQGIGSRRVSLWKAPHQSENLENLRSFLKALGAEEYDLNNPSAKMGLTSGNAPRERNLGAIDVFEHEFGQNLLLTPLTAATGHRVTLAQLASMPYEPPTVREAATLPRHAAFLAELASTAESAHQRRSYLRDVFAGMSFGVAYLNGISPVIILLSGRRISSTP